MSSRLHFGSPAAVVPLAATPEGEVGRLTAWEDTLDDLEANVDRVATAVAHEVPDSFLDLDATWVPPADLGPLPDHLRERAALLLSRQLAVAEGLVHDITWSKQQREVASRMTYAKTRPAGAFFDNRL